MRVLWALPLFLLFFGADRCCAQKYLTGELSGTYPEGEYIISGNVHVLPSTTLAFAPGCVLRFENYTGIVVRGKLICPGTPLRPISFTSSRDTPNSVAKPEPFDWNGIKVTAEAESIAIEHCTIAYSTFGLTIESNATPVSIKETAFHDNGSASLTREKRMLPVAENVPLSFKWPEAEVRGSFPAEAEPSLIPESGKTADGTSRHAAKKPAAGGWKKGVRIATGSVAAAGGIMVITGSILSNHYHNKYVSASTEISEQSRKKRDNANLMWMAGLAAFGISAVGFAVTFAF